MMDEKDEIIKLLEFDVSGMSCDRCAMWVTEAIKKNVENVVDVRVKSVKTTERNVCVSLKLLLSDDDEKKGASSSSSKTETKNIIRALELAGYGCVESNENNTTMKTTTNPGVFSDDDEDEEEEKGRLIKSSNSVSSFTEKQTIKSKTYHFNVEGMTCASCVSGVENAIKSIQDDSMISFSVNLLSESATVVIANDSKLKPDDIANEISDFGFDCAVSKPDAMKFNVSGMVCQSCPPRIENAILKRFPNDVVSVSASELLEKVVVEMKPGTSVARGIFYTPFKVSGTGAKYGTKTKAMKKKDGNRNSSNESTRSSSYSPSRWRCRCF